MLVRCPNCQTTYRVSDESVPDVPTFRCSRCKSVFEMDRESRIQPHADGTFPFEAPPPVVPEEPELSFTFPAREQDFKSGDHDSEFSGDAVRTPAPATDLEDEAWSLNAGAQHQEEPFTIAPSAHAAPEKITAGVQSTLPKPQPDANSFPDTRDSTGNVFPLDTFRDQPASTVPYVTLLAVLVLFFSFAAAYQQVYPQVADQIIGKIPLLGDSVLHNVHLKNGVLLKSLRGGYQTIQGNREVFVVSGEALNRNPVVIRRVQIAGQLYDQTGKAIEQQIIWVGNAISAKIVRGMSAQDVIDLQRLQPLKSFDIPPGDSVPFTIVFFKPSRSVKDFSCEVQSAESAA